jgi:hypothetical protein
VATCAGLRALLAARLDSRRRARAPARRSSPRARQAALVATVAAAVAAGLALGAPHALAQDWNRFLSGAVPHGNTGDLRERLTDPSNNGRSDLWRVAARGFSASPLHGRGAGMYQTLWDRDRALSSYAVNAHSLYLQAMAELGVPGLVALVVLVGSVLIGLARRARGRRRSIYAALLAAGIVWAIHAGVDWDWEMPVVTIGFFAAGGLALGPRGQRQPRRAPSGRARLLLALPCLAALVLPVLIVGWQVQLDRAKRALYASDCSQAMPAARSSAAWLGAGSQPYEILGLCHMQRGQPQPALIDMRRALSRDPGSWEAYYMLALAEAQAGEDPIRAALAALRMNPREQLTREAARVLLRAHPRQWPERARSLRAAALESKDLSILPA